MSHGDTHATVAPPTLCFQDTYTPGSAGPPSRTHTPPQAGPDPGLTCTAKLLLWCGALKASPVTSFQPASSFMSRLLPSTTSCSYLARSRRTVRTRIMATMVAITRTTSTEFTMLNQCTCKHTGGGGGPVKGLQDGGG